VRITWSLALLIGAPAVAILPHDQAPSSDIRHLHGDSVVMPLTRVQGLTPIGVAVTAVTYRGRLAVRVIAAPTALGDSASETVAMIDGLDFSSGTIEVPIAGRNTPGADTSGRGFVGVVFRSDSLATRFENVYVRPTNGRATDQLRRNHTVQYDAVPDYPWYRLRKENPGRYESYADLDADGWTKIRVVVHGTRARIFVNDASQPCLIVNDLKLGDTHGRIGLWIGTDAEAYFSHLVVTSATKS
jgi:hypothetical protein